MKRAQFDAIIDELKNVYGDSKYSAIRCHYLFEKYKNVPGQAFKNACEQIIRSSRFAPLDADFEGLLSSYLPKKGRLKDNGCPRCKGTGRVLVKQKLEPAYSQFGKESYVAINCTCSNGIFYNYPCV